jgi:hypothetical protein
MDRAKINIVYAKSVVNRTNLPGVDYSVNPYVGCEHACAYCHAANMRRYTGHTHAANVYTYPGPTNGHTGSAHAHTSLADRDAYTEAIDSGGRPAAYRESRCAVSW